MDGCQVSSEKGLITPVVRTSKILFELCAGPLTIDQIVQKTKIPKTSVFRLLNTLETCGFIERKETDGFDLWNLGLSVLNLAQARLSQIDMREEIRDIVENLAEKIDEFVQVGILYQGKVLYIDIVKRPKPLSVYGEIGTIVPINVSAAGMVLAAYLPEPEMEKLLNEQSFPKNTTNTCTDPKALKKVLLQVRENGFAIDDQEYAIGIRCVAAPVFNHLGQAVAALNITGSIFTLSDERLDSLVEEAKKAAYRASKKLGSSGGEGMLETHKEG